jgi:hypothetical protein
MTAERLPNFLIIGAAKCGTTALYSYLQQHPDVFLSPSKEPQFFAFEGETLRFRGPGVTINETAITRLDDYRALFADVRGESAIGEASALYLYVEKAADRIRRHLPEVRLIAILRNPVDRAYSSFMHLRREGREPITDFRAALAAESGRIRDDWGFLWRYRDMGRYHEKLRRYYDRFPREQIQVLLYDDFRADAPAAVRSVFRFLGVDEGFLPDTSLEHNVSGIPRSRAVYDALWGKSRVGRALEQILPGRWLADVRARSASRLLRREPLDPALREELIREWREDVLPLQDLIGRDLSRWLEPRAARSAG